MVYGLGDQILIEVNLPQTLIPGDNVETETVNAIHAVIQDLLPDAYVQCKLYPFDTGRGYRATGT